MPNSSREFGISLQGQRSPLVSTPMGAAMLGSSVLMRRYAHGPARACCSVWGEAVRDSARPNNPVKEAS